MSYVSTVLSGVLKFKNKLNSSRQSQLNHDPSIKRFEHLIRSSYTVIGQLDRHLRNIEHSPINKKRRFIAFSININFILIMVRSLMYFGTFKNHAKLDLLGDYFWALGLVGDIIHFWLVAYSVLILLFRLVMSHSEKTGHLDILTDFMVVPGQSKSLLKSTLTQANFLKFCYRSKRCIQFVHLYFIGVITTVTVMQLLAMHWAYRSRPNVLMVLYHTVWLMSLQAWLYYACSTFTVLLSVFYLSAMYVEMRFKQINDKCTLLHVEIRQAGGSKSISLELKLDDIMHEHHEVTKRVSRYNFISKWVLFGFNFICGPIAAVSLFVPIYGEFSDPLLGIAILGLSIQITCTIMFFAGVAGKVYNAARLSYPRLNSIKNACGHRMDKFVNNRLKCLIMAVGSDRYPISLCCYDLFAYTNNSFFEVSFI